MKWLRTSGPRIVTEDGKPIRLRGVGVGVGVGGWLNTENFITGYPATETAHRDAMRKALGRERYELFPQFGGPLPNAVYAIHLPHQDRQGAGEEGRGRRRLLGHDTGRHSRRPRPAAGAVRG